MAYPTGSGSERIHRGAIHNQVNTATAFRFDGGISATGTSSGSGYSVATNHIITIMSILFAEQSNASRTFDLYCEVTTPSTGMNFLQQQPLAAYETFVWNEKIVLHPGDALKVIASASSNMDVWYTYIDQDWT